MPIETSKRLMIKTYKLYILIFAVLAAIGFVTMGLPALTGDISLQTYSDSLTYERLSRNLPPSVSLISVSSNLIGPIAILRMFDYNYVMVFLFNMIIFLVSLKIIFTYYDLKKNIFLFFVCSSPLFFFSLFNVNKEILVLFDTALFLAFLKNRSALYLLLALAVSLLIRWQMTLFILHVLQILAFDKYFCRRKLVVFGIVAGLSVIYPMLYNLFEAVIRHSLPDNDAVSGSGIFQRLNSIQNTMGGYILVFLPKLLQINFGIIKRFHMIADLSLFWNYFVLMLHSVASLFLATYVVFKRRFTFDNALIFVSMIYAALFALSPIINVRYFLPIYIIFAVIASNRGSEISRLPKMRFRRTPISKHVVPLVTQKGTGGDWADPA